MKDTKGDILKITGRYLTRDKNENIVAITDSISYKMIKKEHRDKYTFAFSNIGYREAEDMVNNNLNHCIGAVGHESFAKDLNRVLNIDYTIPYGRGKERVHLTLTEGDYVIIISRISNRAGTYDNQKRYTSLVNVDDIMFTMAKVIEVPPTTFEIKCLNEGEPIET